MPLLRRLALVAALVFAPLLALANNPALTAALDSPALVWTTGGDRDWISQTRVSFDGTDAAGATELAQASTTLDAESWIETTLTAPGMLTWRWRLDLSADQSFILEVFVGSETSPRQTLFPANDWTAASLPLDGSGPVAVRWRLRRLDSTESPPPDEPGALPPNAAYLDTVTFTPFGPPVLQTPTGLSARGFTARWTALTGATSYTLQLGTSADFSDALDLAPDAAPATSLSVTDLEPATTYHYRLVAAGPDALTAVSAPASLSTSALIRPTNDAFASATSLSGASGSSSASTLEATVEPSEPFAHQGSVWYRWTAPSTGLWRFRTAASETHQASLFAYSGSELATLEPLAASLPGDEPGIAVLEFDATTGASYRIALDAAPGAQAATSLSWSLLDAYLPPANDAFAAPQTFSGTSGSLDTTNLHATAEPAETSTATTSIWFRWTAPESGFLTLDTTGSAIPTTLSAWSGNSLAGLSLLATDSAGSTSAITFPVVKNASYRISLDGEAGAEGALRLSWSLAVPSLAQTITVPVIGPLPIDAPAFLLDGFADSGLPLTFTRLSGPATLEGDFLTLSGQPGIVMLRASQPGNATYLPAQLDFQFTVQGPPAHDLRANATPLAGSAPFETDLRFATASADDPFPGLRSVWFRWTAPSAGILTLDTTGSAVSTALTALSGPIAEPEFVAADIPDSGPARLELPVTSGTSYWIALDTLADPAGTARLTWSFANASLAQTIDFAPLPDLGPQPALLFLEASASSGLPVVFTLLSGPATLDEGVLSLSGAPGLVRIRASQPGDTSFLAAPPVTVTFTVRPPPANDLAANATRLTGASGSVTSSSLDATAAPGDPFPANRSVWFRWTSPATGVWTVDTAGSALPATLALLTGPSAASLELLANDAPSTGSGRLSIPVSSGTTYWIVLDSLDASEGALALSWSLAPPSLEQTITFDQPLPDLILGDAAPQIFASASSGLPVTLSVVSGPATLADGVLILGGRPGRITLRATQPGDATYLPAPELTRSFTVLPLPALKITLSNLSQTYDGDPRIVTATTETAPRLKPLLVTYNGSPTPPVHAGTYSVVATADDSRATGKLVVAKRPLQVTALDAYKLAGQPNPTFALEYAGFAPGDDASDLTRLPRATSPAKTKSPGGTYPIRVAGGVSSDYTFSYTPGILTVDTFAGRREALLTDPLTGEPVGKLELTIAASGALFTGRLELTSEPVVISLRDEFALDAESGLATATLALSQPGRAYDLALSLSLFGDFSATLHRDEVVSGETTSVLLGETATGKTLFAPAPREKITWAGAHTLLLLPASTSASAAPAGSGHATATINAKGQLKLSGRLADGAALTGNLAPDFSGTYRLFARPYGKRADSALIGELPLANHPDATRFPGRRYLPLAETPALFWSKAALPDSTPAKRQDVAYRAGFGPLAVRATLDPWLPPARRPATRTLAQRLGLAATATEAGAFVLEFGPTDLDFGNLASSLPTAGTLSPAGAFALSAPVTIPANATQFSLKFTASTGAFRGGFTLIDQANPPAAKPHRRPVTFTGVLRQRPELDSASDSLVGAGSFLLPPGPDSETTERRSGELRLTAPLPTPLP